MSKIHEGSAESNGRSTAFRWCRPSRVSEGGLRYLNLGCGRRSHADWTNLDYHGFEPGVLAFDLRKGIPFDDCCFDVVYHSHVLEHFGKAEAPTLLRECYRVLAPGGIIRVAVPDLESIARQYLLALERACRNEGCANADYEWMMLEMYDQAVRHRSGGEIFTYLSRPGIENLPFVRRRWGSEAENILGYLGNGTAKPAGQSQMKRILHGVVRIDRYPHYIRELLLRLMLGSEHKTLQIGRFRLGGEIHHWMYDRYSLGRLLASCGFGDIRQYAATESQIPCWSRYNLDTEPDGSVYKPDSLYMEATKAPASNRVSSPAALAHT